MSSFAGRHPALLTVRSYNRAIVSPYCRIYDYNPAAWVNSTGGSAVSHHQHRACAFLYLALAIVSALTLLLPHIL
jgi:hypothetical protein